MFCGFTFIMHNRSPCDEPKAGRIFTCCHNIVGYLGLKSNIQVRSGHCASEVPVRNWAKRAKISEWAMKQAQWPVHSTLGNIMVLMTCTMGMWILNIGLPSGRSKKSCPFCLARGLKRGTKGHMRTIMYMQGAYVQAEHKNFVIPQTLEQFPRNHTPFPEKGLPPCSTLQDPL